MVAWFGAAGCSNFHSGVIKDFPMGEKITTIAMPHIKAASYVDDQVDKFDAFGITWNDDEAIHITFGRNTVNVKTTRFFLDDGVPGSESGDVDVIRLDVAGLTLPLNTAKELVETLSKMIASADARNPENE